MRNQKIPDLAKDLIKALWNEAEQHGCMDTQRDYQRAALAVDAIVAALIANEPTKIIAACKPLMVTASPGDFTRQGLNNYPTLLD